MTKALITIAVALVVATGRADAYPQFQLSRDQTCTGCHISPAGGNLLNENGLAAAESMSQLGTAPEFMYGKIAPPSWLVLGGDLRGAAGYLKTPEDAVAAFPMQIELYGTATFADHFSFHANFGPRPSMEGNEAATSVWAREHYFMWQQKPGETEGLYVRAGRFMPVIGLRLAEHPTYIRRYGGTALYADTYGLAVELVTRAFEVHATAFVKDFVIEPVEHYSGGAAYGEVRLGENLAIGAEAMVEVSKDDKRYRGGVTGKVFIPAADVLVQGEVQLVNQVVDATDGRGAPIAVVSYLLLSRMLGDFFLLDLGLGHYDPSVKWPSAIDSGAHPGLKYDERDCIDLNFHWFATSHAELVLNSRYETIGFGNGGGPGAYTLLQLHYRL